VAEPNASVENVDWLVIGAGVSGLGFANWWRELEPTASVLVCEAAPEVGGYCKTVVQDGFVWDYSGHFFHFKDPSIEQWLRARMPGQDIRTVERRAKIRYAGRDIDFPFQMHIHQLPTEEFLECLVALFFRPHGDEPPHSFGEMLYRRLGAGITDKFLRPYNEKLYATSLDSLDVDAMGRFFPHADIGDIIANMRPGHARKHGYNATFTYPAGGAIEYIRALEHDLPAGTVACSEPILSIGLTSRIARTPKRAIRFNRLVSSAPLRSLAKICSVEHDAHVFTSNQVLVFNLGFDKKGMRDIHWMYFPDPAISFYRVGWYDNILDGDRMSLYVEIGAPDGASVASRGSAGARSGAEGGAEVIDVPGLRERVLADLRKEGIVTDQQLVSEHHVALDPAYCHITKASLAETQRLRELLASHGVYSVGRYGAWTYCSIEDNLIETRELARRLHAGG
jgi:protoporphyrinogen oxidase